MSTKPDPRFVEVLTKSEIFFGIPVLELLSLIAHAKMIRVSAGASPIQENGLVDGLHFILDGSVQVMKSGSPVTSLEKGGFFGEISLFSMNIVASATVTALSNCSILVIDRMAMESWLTEHPESEARFFKNLCTELCHRLLNTTEQLVKVNGAR